jgi:nicotinamidase-related amidase
MNPQNSFLSETGSVYMGERAEILKIRIVDFLSRFPKKIIYFREKHALEDNFFISDKTHSITNTRDFLICDSLKKYATDIIDKTRFNAFYETPLERILLQLRVKHIGIIGVETHSSVLFTAEELRNRLYEVTVIEPCVMSRENYLHSYSITLMRHLLGVRITNG